MKVDRNFMPSLLDFYIFIGAPPSYAMSTAASGATLNRGSLTIFPGFQVSLSENDQGRPVSAGP
ncbi:MAG: hypothetical protein ABFC78_03940, partial [Methanoregula sp.]